ncbi:hypothetical protein AMTR_s00016p00135150 [Amborella trichopoda]|uniref:Uncharacterized protein n=1 Tax=Amborella trichopoda TaxID=13333 RepID=W1PGH5_AMBTC|nr:hypothetical protein AMTR_s00016p00135150 [Amborella trichopoda]
MLRSIPCIPTVNLPKEEEPLKESSISAKVRPCKANVLEKKSNKDSFDAVLLWCPNHLEMEEIMKELQEDNSSSRRAPPSHCMFYVFLYNFSFSGLWGRVRSTGI